MPVTGPFYLDIARLDAADVAGVRYIAADLERDVPEGPYDLAYARFGTMFFAQPVVALRNVRRALVPGGRLCMVVWCSKIENECFYTAEAAVRRVLGNPDKGDQLTRPSRWPSEDEPGDYAIVRSAWMLDVHGNERIGYEERGAEIASEPSGMTAIQARPMHRLASEDSIKTTKHRAARRTGADADGALAAAAQGVAPTSDDAAGLRDGEDRRETDVIGKAAGVVVADGKPLGGLGEIERRDAYRWELDPASADEPATVLAQLSGRGRCGRPRRLATALHSRRLRGCST